MFTAKSPIADPSSQYVHTTTSLTHGHSDHLYTLTRSNDDTPLTVTNPDAYVIRAVRAIHGYSGAPD